MYNPPKILPQPTLTCGDGPTKWVMERSQNVTWRLRQGYNGTVMVMVSRYVWVLE